MGRVILEARNVEEGFGVPASVDTVSNETHFGGMISIELNLCDDLGLLLVINCHTVEALPRALYAAACYR